MVVYRLETRKTGRGPFASRRGRYHTIYPELKEVVGNKVFASLCVRRARRWSDYFDLYKLRRSGYVISVYDVPDEHCIVEPRSIAGCVGRYEEVVFDRTFAKKIKEIPV